MMKITEEMLDYVSALSRLSLPAAEQSQMVGELQCILDYMDVLNTLDTEGKAPLTQRFPLKNLLRPDEPAPSLCRAALLQNAPMADADAFLVPKTVE